MIRAVLDANVIVAAMLNPGGPPAEVVRQVGLAYELVWSPPVVAECHRVTDYRKLRTRFRLRDPPPAGSSAATSISSPSVVSRASESLAHLLSWRS